MRPSPGLGRSQERWFVDSGTVYRRTTVTDAGGGFSSTWASVGTVSAEVTTPSATEKRIAAQEGEELSAVLLVGLTEAVTIVRGDRVVIGSTAYEVTGIEQSTISTVRRCRVKAEPWDEPTT